MKYILTIDKDKYNTEDVALVLKSKGIKVSSVFSIAGVIVVEHVNRYDLLIEGVTNIDSEGNKQILLG